MVKRQELPSGTSRDRSRPSPRSRSIREAPRHIGRRPAVCRPCTAEGSCAGTPFGTRYAPAVNDTQRHVKRRRMHIIHQYTVLDVSWIANRSRNVRRDHKNERSLLGCGTGVRMGRSHVGMGGNGNQQRIPAHKQNYCTLSDKAKPVIFTERRYASAVLAVVVCPSVRPSVRLSICHTPVL